MTVAASKKIRALLKAAGYGKADVSVYNKSYSMGSTVYVTIKRAEIPLMNVEKIAFEGEEVRRDGYGDILEGGNCFVDTRYAHGLLDDYAAQINAQIGAGRERFGVFSIMTDDRFTLSVWRDSGDGSGSHVLKVDRASPGDGLARLLAREGMLHELEPESVVEHAPPANGNDDVETLIARGNEVAVEMFGAAPAAPLASAQLDVRPLVPSVITLARPDGPVYSLDEDATGERLAARVVRAAERWQAAFPCPAADEPRLRALWLAVERLIAHDESL